MKIHNTALLALLLTCAASTSALAADRSVGVILGEFGPGLNYSSKTPFSFRDDDQLQLRVQLSGVSSDEVEDAELNDNKYTGEADFVDHKITADWYPFAKRQFFVTAGLGYLKNDIKLKSKSGRAYTVDNVVVANDGSTLSVDVDQSAFAPYVGIGWGNKLEGHDGLSFFVEMGLMKPLSDSDVRVASNSSSVSQANIEQEQRDLEDDFNDIRLSAALGLSYRF